MKAGRKIRNKSMTTDEKIAYLDAGGRLAPIDWEPGYYVEMVGGVLKDEEGDVISLSVLKRDLIPCVVGVRITANDICSEMGH